MNHYAFLIHKCPKLYDRLQEDAEKGDFRWDWEISSDRSQNYIGSICGRQIEGWETIQKTMEEAESKL